MTKKELIEALEAYPDYYKVVLIDTTTDDENDCCYTIKASNIEAVELMSKDEKIVKGIAITFDNKLNENHV